MSLIIRKIFTKNFADGIESVVSNGRMTILDKKIISPYVAVKKVLQKVKDSMPRFKPKTLLDYCSGVGEGVLAATESFPELECLLIEPSDLLKGKSKKICNDLSKKTYNGNLANLPFVTEPNSIYDIVTCWSVLSQIECLQTRNFIIDALWDRTGKIIIFIEPNTNKGTQLIYSAYKWAQKIVARHDVEILACSFHNKKISVGSEIKPWWKISIVNWFFSNAYKEKEDNDLQEIRDYDRKNDGFCYIVVRRGGMLRYNLEKKELYLAENTFIWPRSISSKYFRQRIIYNTYRIVKLERCILWKSAVKQDAKFSLKGVYLEDWYQYKKNSSGRCKKSEK